MNNKSVLVIDTPLTCEECILYNVVYYPDKNKKENICYKYCPLRPLPEKMSWGHTVDYIEGYNACLDEITGETE